MKTNLVLFVLIASLSSSLAFAQKGIDNGTKYGSGDDSIRCLTNINLFVPYAKQNDFKSAAEFWEVVFDECPGSSIFIYRYGPQIVSFQLQQEKDPAKRALLFEKLMSVYDKRIQYFGEDGRYPAPWIIGMKALDYANYINGDKVKMTQALKWLEESMDGMGESTEVSVLYKFMELSTAMYKVDPKGYAASYIDNYLKVCKVFDLCISRAPKNMEAYKQTREGVDVMFASSGAADCETLNTIFTPMVEVRKADLNYLKGLITLFSRVKCTETAAYFAASTYMHQIEPTAASANGCAAQSYKKGEIAQAIKYWDEAVSLESDNEQKADYLFKMAVVTFAELKNYPRAREYARRVIDLDPSRCDAYILIAKMYASSSISQDPVLNRTRYWAAVDKLQQAKQASSDCADEVNALINSYAGGFPNKEDVFMHSELNAGSRYTVGGWIGESTICR